MVFKDNKVAAGRYGYSLPAGAGMIRSLVTYSWIWNGSL
jgi:hypothetical protein